MKDFQFFSLKFSILISCYDTQLLILQLENILHIDLENNEKKYLFTLVSMAI